MIFELNKKNADNVLSEIRLNYSFLADVKNYSNIVTLVFLLFQNTSDDTSIFISMEDNLIKIDYTKSTDKEYFFDLKKSIESNSIEELNILFKESIGVNFKNQDFYQVCRILKNNNFDVKEYVNKIIFYWNTQASTSL